MKPSVDVVIPVENNFHALRFCLSSVRRFTPDHVRVFLVLSGCDHHTVTKCSEWAEKRTNTSIVDLGVRMGIVQAANAGLGMTDASASILLAPEICVTKNWTGKLVHGLEADPWVGIVAPLSNIAPGARIELPPGFDYVAVGDFIENMGAPVFPSLARPGWGCIAISRRCLDSIGPLDPVLAERHDVALDYSLRAGYYGFKTRMNDDTFVFHPGRVVAGVDETARKRSRNIVESRWKSIIEGVLAEDGSQGVVKRINSALGGLCRTGYQRVLWI
ncbi:MAG: glycosyltransferase [Deltaproteobacteria bacterium]|nr:glycosyltransferase [Deltaproteobacteria bacterium]